MEANPHADLPGRRCEGCGAVMPARTHRERDDHQRLVCPSCLAGQPAWSVQAQPAREATMGPWTRDIRLRAAQHLAEGHGWDPVTLADLPLADLAGLHGGLHSAARSYDWAPQPRHSHDLPRVVSQQVRGSVRRLAHDAPDDTRVMHCPWCGSGQVVGGSDGSVNCEYCHRTFVVRLQPAYPAMPQTDPATGMPIEVQDPNILGPGGPPPMPGVGPPAEMEDPAQPVPARPMREEESVERTGLLRYLALVGAADQDAYLAVADAIHSEAS